MCEALCLSGLASALTFSVRLQGDTGVPTLTLQSLGGAYPPVSSPLNQSSLLTTETMA